MIQKIFKLSFSFFKMDEIYSLSFFLPCRLFQESGALRFIIQEELQKRIPGLRDILSSMLYKHPWPLARKANFLAIQAQEPSQRNIMNK